MGENTARQLGNYRLQRPIGRGSFAEVYLGEHIYLQTQAAIKLLHLQLGGTFLENFLNEARTIARLRHPNIVGLLEFGIESGTRTPFLVMEYAPNGTLRQCHPTGTRLPLSQVLVYLKQIAAGLQFAHNEKLIHRDLKPENLLLGAENEVLLADFGIALVAQSSDQRPQEFAGTAAYMAPEQIRGRSGFASDQYALGVIIYEWLSGSVPFRGSFPEIVNQHLHTSPMPLHLAASEIPPQVEQVVLRALAKDPQQRFVSVQAFADAFEQACRTESFAIKETSPGVSTLPLVSSPASEDGLSGSMMLSASASISRRRIVSPGRTLLLIMLVSLLVGGSGWLYYTRAGSPARRPLQAPSAQTTISRTAQEYLTATSASPTLDDSLTKNSTSNWVEYVLSKGGGCAFKDGAYYSTIFQIGLSLCLAQGTDFNDFAFQAQVSIQRGDEGGLLFRSDAIDPNSYPFSTNYYLFSISSGGRYRLAYQGDKLIELLGGVSTLIKSGAGEANLLTVIARRSTISLYINAQYLASINDAHRASGLVGLFARETGNATEIVFRDARVWGLD